MECGEVSAYEINIMELLASFHHDLRFDPSLYPILHNFPIDSSLSPPHLFFYKQISHNLYMCLIISLFSLISPLPHIYPSPLYCSLVLYQLHMPLQPPKAQRVFVFPGGCRGNLATGKAVIISFQSLS